MFMDPDGKYAVVAVYFIPGIGVYVGYKYRHKIRRGAKRSWGRTKSFFKTRSNKNPNRKMKKHKPSKKHKGGK